MGEIRKSITTVLETPIQNTPKGSLQRLPTVLSNEKSISAQNISLVNFMLEKKNKEKHPSFTEEVEVHVDVDDGAKGRVESCPGCKLTGNHDLKQFIYSDLEKFNSISFKKVKGYGPDLVLLDDNDRETERIPLNNMNRKECIKLLLSKGFILKNSKCNVTECSIASLLSREKTAEEDQK